MKIITDEKKINEVLTRGANEVIVKEDLREKLLSGKKLRIKFGIDPTAAFLHIGHAVPLRKLKQFQDLGHEVILLIGDYTAKIGDPTGRNEARPLLSDAEIKKNMKTYTEQAGKVLNIKKVEIRYNSEWYKDKGAAFMLELTSLITVARILDRDDFQKRLKADVDIQMQEILYPLLQGYDSVVLKSDVEIGGTDQKFNLLMGRKLQKRYDQPEQDVITVPLLEGLDGVRKMSKSFGNFIALADEPNEMFGKAMSVPDDLIIKYLELATEVPLEEIEEMSAKMKGGANPRDFKLKLAYELVKLYHDEKAAKSAQEYFAKTIQQKGKPEEIPEIKPSAYDILTVLTEAKIAKSKSEARRLVEQGGVKVNDAKIDSIETKVKAGDIVQKGSRFFIKVK